MNKEITPRSVSEILGGLFPRYVVEIILINIFFPILFALNRVIRLDLGCSDTCSRELSDNSWSLIIYEPLQRANAQKMREDIEEIQAVGGDRNFMYVGAVLRPIEQRRIWGQRQPPHQIIRSHSLNWISIRWGFMFSLIMLLCILYLAFFAKSFTSTVFAVVAFVFSNLVVKSIDERLADSASMQSNSIMLQGLISLEAGLTKLEHGQLHFASRDAYARHQTHLYDTARYIEQVADDSVLKIQAGNIRRRVEELAIRIE